MIRQSLSDIWDLAPRISDGNKNDDNNEASSSSSNARNGFGKEVERVVKHSKKKNRRPRN
jgi:hypothetical protein